MIDKEVLSSTVCILLCRKMSYSFLLCVKFNINMQQISKGREKQAFFIIIDTFRFISRLMFPQVFIFQRFNFCT